MSITKERKTEVIQSFQTAKEDTGSSEIQIAIFTERINNLTEHVQIHKKDNHTRFGLLRLVNKRKRLLKYIKREDQQRYATLIERLGIRK